MGYYTRYSLTVKDIDETDKIREALTQLYGMDPFEDSTKWYDSDENCIQVSRQFPDTLFAISGDGEEQGDRWRKVYQNGACVKEERQTPIQFDPL